MQVAVSAFVFCSSVRFQGLALKLHTNYNNDNDNLHMLTAPGSQTSCCRSIISNQLTVLQGNVIFPCDFQRFSNTARVTKLLKFNIE